MSSCVVVVSSQTTRNAWLGVSPWKARWLNSESMKSLTVVRSAFQSGRSFGSNTAQVRFRIKPDFKIPPKLRRILEGHIPVTLSGLEDRFLAILSAHDLPIPITNRVATAKRVDCRWPAHHLTVELDSYRYHGTRHAWEEDRRREREAHARGDQHRRYTYGDVFEDPRQMLSELQALLA